MRPAGEISQAVLRAAWDVCSERVGTPMAAATHRDVVERLVPKGVAQHAVRNTWKNLVRSGQLKPVQPVKALGASRPLLACVPASALGVGFVRQGLSAPAGADLGAALQRWATVR